MANILLNHLNCFPTELWQELFRYLSANELWHSFRGLNAKIDAVIDHSNLDLNLKHKDDYNYFARMILPSIDVIYVRSLILGRSDDIKNFFSKYSLDSLLQLRVLSLDDIYPFNDLSFKFWNQLASLKYLRSLKLRWGYGNTPDTITEEKEFIIQSIFNKDFCPLLKCLSMISFQYQKWERTIPLLPAGKATKIEYLSLDLLLFNELIKLLPAMQNVNSFHVAYLRDDKDFTDEQPRAITATIPLLPRCVELNLKLVDGMRFEQVEFIVQQTPNLKKMYFQVKYNLLYAKRWELLLSKYCPKVTNFDLSCTGSVYNDILQDELYDFQRECQSSSFWIERKASVTGSHDPVYDDNDMYVTVRFDLNKDVGVNQTKTDLSIRTQNTNQTDNYIRIS